ncbi:MAG: MFS transporter, partial [Actinomycetota bacterium]|nr:MFS transporter [Actinomycetota bacterium]
MSRGSRVAARPLVFSVEPVDTVPPPTSPPAAPPSVTGASKLTVEPDVDLTTPLPDETEAAFEAKVGRQARFALATGSLAFVLGTVNVTVTNVAFADIKADFDGVAEALTGWILSGYSLAFASTMLVGGRLADRYGRLLVFRIGLAGL